MSRSAACRLIVIAALLACAGASRARAQDPERLHRARAGLSGTAATRFDQILRKAAGRGLPTSPLVDKALEGEAKHAPPERILAVVQQLADNLGRARSLLQPGRKPTTEDIAAVADALRRGVPERAVRALHAQRPASAVALPVETLADLVQVGVPEPQALALLQAWSDRGGKTSDLRDLPATIERMRHSGTLPAQAAQMLTRSMRGSDGRGRVERSGEGASRGRSEKIDRGANPAGGPGRAPAKPRDSRPPHPTHR